jgi:hypothetical protein
MLKEIACKLGFHVVEAIEYYETEEIRKVVCQHCGLYFLLSEGKVYDWSDEIEELITKKFDIPRTRR